MRNVSSAFLEQLANDKLEYQAYATITLSSGTTLNLTNENFWQGGFTTEDSVSDSNEFEVGAAIINKCTLVINNIYDDFTQYDFTKAQVVAKIGLKLADGTIETIQKGVYTVDEAKYNGSIITLSCVDNMANFDKEYSASTLTYPATLGEIVRDACSHCNVSLLTTSFPHSDYTVKTKPEDSSMTFRNAIQWAAQIAGCFARCNYQGYLELKWYY